jgi:hypothetical protein
LLSRDRRFVKDDHLDEIGVGPALQSAVRSAALVECRSQICVGDSRAGLELPSVVDGLSFTLRSRVV